MRERSHYGHVSAFDKRGEQAGIDFIDIAHKAEIDHLLRAVVHLDALQRTPVTTDDVAVGTSQADGLDTLCLQASHDILVHQTAIDHRHHAEHLLVRNATTAHHAALYAETRSHRRCQSPAAMHQHLAAFHPCELV